MLFGIGVDVVRTARLRSTYNRFGLRFLRRAISPSEIEEFFRRGEREEPTERARGSGEDGAVSRVAAGCDERTNARQIEFLASRWAVKEACHKALGKWRLPFPEIVLRSGRRDGGGDGNERRGESERAGAIADAVRHPLERSLYRKDAHAPYVSFEGSALQVVETLGIQKSHVSISHDDGYAFAAVVLESKDGAPSDLKYNGGI